MSVQTIDQASAIKTAEIAKAEQDARAAAEAHQLAEQTRQDMEEKLAEMRQQAVQAKNQAAKAAQERELAERRIIEARRRVVAPPVTRDDAVDAANRIVAAMAVSDSTTAEAVWDIIDDVRCRLLTEDVAEDAQPIVLATESVIEACDRWEADRANDAPVGRYATQADMEEDRRVTKLQRMPGSSPLVGKRLYSLKHVLAGTQPKLNETLGTLIAQNVSFNQICNIYGFILPGGGPNLANLGMAVDRALKSGGFYDEGGAARWPHMTAEGVLTAKEAWQFRLSYLPERKRKVEKQAGEPGTPSSVDGKSRPGRHPTMDPERSRHI